MLARREELYRKVERQRLSPVEADDRLRQLGLKPFESRFDQSNFEPMQEEEWTLPMATAWFIWRSCDAVRDQWDPARKGWRKWVRTPRRRNLIAAPHGPRWKLKNFGNASLAEVFGQAGLSGGSSQRKTAGRRLAGGSSVRTHNARSQKD